MRPEIDAQAARAALEWLVELGCDEAILDHPLNRFALPDRIAAPEAPPPLDAGEAAPPVPEDPVAAAEHAAAGAADLDALGAAVARYQHCDLRLGTAAPVLADGLPGARVMVVGDAPDRDEARAGRPFAGPAGALLDAMLAAIGLARDASDPERAVYLTAALPWRPSGREPDPAALAMMRPFLARRVALAAPEVMVLMGNDACAAALGERGMTRLRGTWTEAFGVPALPILSPRYLLDRPRSKREAWADLLALAARLDLPPPVHRKEPP